MKFHSILFDQESFPQGEVEQPDFFTDLNLDQVIHAITASREDYHLKPFFWTPQQDAGTIHYRHEVMGDLDDQTLLAHIQEFGDGMILARRHLARAEKLQHLYHREGWFLESALAYCAAVTDLKQGLDLASVRSNGFLSFRDYMQEYVSSQGFQLLQADAQKVKAGLAESRYNLNIGIGRFIIQKYEGESDYSEEVERIFAKFKHGAMKDYRSGFPYGTGMNPVEAKILELVARLYPQQFADLDQFCAHHGQFLDETICTFDREIQFYIAYLEFIGSLRQKGLKFCYPQVGTSREVYSYDGFDLALANSLARRANLSSATISPSTSRNGSWSLPAPTREVRPRLRAPSDSCTTLPVLACLCPAGKRGFSCLTASSPILSAGRISAACAASCRMTWSACTRSRPVPHQTAFSSSMRSSNLPRWRMPFFSAGRSCQRWRDWTCSVSV